MKRILMMLLVMSTMNVNAQWKVGIVKKELNNPNTVLRVGNRIGYIKNRNNTYTLFESIIYEEQDNKIGNCSEQYFKSHVTLTDFYYGHVTDPKDDYVNIRKGPGTNYPVVYKCGLGSRIIFKKTGNNWYEVYGSRDYKDTYGPGLYIDFQSYKYDLRNLIKIGYIYRDRIKKTDICFNLDEL